MRWEVRTMRSGTSFFDLTVWKKTVLRFWPIWAAGLVFWGLLLPVRGLRILQVQVLYGDDQMRQFAASVGEMGGGEASWLPVERMGIRGHGQVNGPCGQEP